MNATREEKQLKHYSVYPRDIEKGIYYVGKTTDLRGNHVFQAANKKEAIRMFKISRGL